MNQQKKRAIAYMCILIISCFSIPVSSFATSEENLLSDGTYEIETTILHATKDEASKANSCIDNIAKLEVNQGVPTLYFTAKSLSMGAITASMQTFQITLASGDIITAKAETTDESGIITCFSVELPVLEEFYSMNINIDLPIPGHDWMEARLKLNLSSLKRQDQVPYADGLYQVNIGLWHATKDQPSMANGAVKTTSYMSIEQGKPMMYLFTDRLVIGVIEATLEELKITDGMGGYVVANIRSTDENGKPICFSFELPSFDEYISVLVNPKVAIMGNSDIEARIKIDYSSMTPYLKDEIEIPEDNIETPEDNIVNDEVNTENEQIGESDTTTDLNQGSSNQDDSSINTESGFSKPSVDTESGSNGNTSNSKPGSSFNSSSDTITNTVTKPNTNTTIVQQSSISNDNGSVEEETDTENMNEENVEENIEDDLVTEQRNEQEREENSNQKIEDVVQPSEEEKTSFPTLPVLACVSVICFIGYSIWEFRLRDRKVK